MYPSDWYNARRKDKSHTEPSPTPMICLSAFNDPNGLAPPRTVFAASYLFSGFRTSAQIFSYAAARLRSTSRCTRFASRWSFSSARRGERTTSGLDSHCAKACNAEASSRGCMAPMWDSGSCRWLVLSEQPVGQRRREVRTFDVLSSQTARHAASPASWMMF